MLISTVYIVRGLNWNARDHRREMPTA